VLSCVGRGLSDRLITRPKESYQVSETDYETSRVRRPIFLKDRRATDDDNDDDEPDMQITHAFYTKFKSNFN
jgi:hypothetical protein